MVRLVCKVRCVYVCVSIFMPEYMIKSFAFSCRTVSLLCCHVVSDGALCIHARTKSLNRDSDRIEGNYS